MNDDAMRPATLQGSEHPGEEDRREVDPRHAAHDALHAVDLRIAVGLAVEDVVTADLAYRRALAGDAGRELEL